MSPARPAPPARSLSECRPALSSSGGAYEPLPTRSLPCAASHDRHRPPFALPSSIRWASHTVLLHQRCARCIKVGASLTDPQLVAWINKSASTRPGFTLLLKRPAHPSTGRNPASRRRWSLLRSVPLAATVETIAPRLTRSVDTSTAHHRRRRQATTIRRVPTTQPTPPGRPEEEFSCYLAIGIDVARHGFALHDSGLCKFNACFVTWRRETAFASSRKLPRCPVASRPVPATAPPWPRNWLGTQRELAVGICIQPSARVTTFR